MNSTHITLGPLVHSDLIGASTPIWLDIEGIRFTYDLGHGCYIDALGQELYIEPDGETITGSSYYELP